MGDHFLISMRFDKQTLTDFGLIPSEEADVFVRQSDGSKWKARPSYDFGWGKENGCYKVPMPDFNELINIIMYSKDNDDKYGAAAVLLDDFCDELLDRCFEILADDKNVKRYSEFFKILNLQSPINRSPIVGKHYSRIAEDFEKWKTLAREVNSILEK